MPEKTLITRPLRQALPLSQELENTKIPCLIEPMLEINSYPPPKELKTYGGIIFTSANTAYACKSWPIISNNRLSKIYVVGQQTQEAVEETGLPNIHNANGNLSKLITLITNTYTERNKPLLYLRGKHTAGDLETSLKNAGLNCDSIIAYEAIPKTALSNECIQALDNQELKTITFFSARTAETFLNLVKQAERIEALKSIKALCLSQTVLKSADTKHWKKTYSCHSPTRKDMIELIQSTYTDI